jgi:hypothetical protein
MGVENINSENIPNPSEGSGQVQGGQSTSAPAPIRPEIDKNYLNEVTSQAIQQQVSSNPQLQQFLKFQEFANQAKEQPKPFQEGINLNNILDAAQYNLNQVDRTQSQIQQQQQLLDQQSGWIAQQQFREGLNNFTSYWEDVYPSEDVFKDAVSRAASADPHLNQKYQAALAGVPNALSVQDLTEIHNNMNWQFNAQVINNEGGILDKLIEHHSRKKLLQEQSMISSNQSIGGSGNRGHDGISAIITMRD